MKKVKLLLILLSTLRNSNGNYAYRIVNATDAETKEEIDLDDIGNVREYEDGKTLFSREKLGVKDKQATVNGTIVSRGGRTYLNLDNPASLKRAQAREELMESDEDLVLRVANISKVAERARMADKAQDILIGTVAGSLFAGVSQTVRRSAVQHETPVTDEKDPGNKKDDEQPELTDEQKAELEAKAAADAAAKAADEVPQ
jgi:hypothetical protein